MFNPYHVGHYGSDQCGSLSCRHSRNRSHVVASTCWGKIQRVAFLRDLRQHLLTWHPPILEMSEIRRLADVFKTVGLPPYTYVKPSYYGEVRSDIEQPGKHLLIEGPSGIGKTCIVFKVFEELGWADGTAFIYLSCRDADADRRITEFLARAVSADVGTLPVFVIDDFHLLSTERRSEIGSVLKRLSDLSFQLAHPPKVVLIGIPTTGISLLSDAYDLGPRIGIYRFARASDDEVERLIDAGEDALNVLFEDRDVLLSEAEGNFWLAQYVCNKVCASEEVYQTQADPRILSFNLLSIRRRLMDELYTRCMPTARVFAKGKKWRPGGNKPYLEVLVALSRVPDSVVTFDKILSVVPERRKPGIKAIRPRIGEVIYDPEKEIDLRKQLAFDPHSGFTIEDPLFRYFLTNLDLDVLYRELGVERESVELAKIYTYDVGFSFAGETRMLVEAVNHELKNEDVVTFYDFDQQAVLLALDLEATLGGIYSASCRYYLVFLDKHYREKVWTKYERDIMTRSGRTNHIIPVVLDSEGAAGTVGIANTVGRIDLQDIWVRARESGVITDDDLNKLDSPDLLA
jgi:hypothetical protein